MHIASIIHRYNRLRELGIRKSAISVQHKIVHKLFHLRWRTKAIDRKAGHTWNAIAQSHGMKISFQEYTQQSILKSLPCAFIQREHLIAQADTYTHNQFDILGSGPQIFYRMPWHEDFRLKDQNPQSDYTFDKQSFYREISLATSAHAEIIKDIKVPWELSRCQHLAILGAAYEKTQSPHYANTFAHHITNWLDNNPYLLGINWLCPMEVGIRAINWIWAWDYFKNSPHISDTFWQQFTCSLYDHMHYLENNWEIFDTKTSNHYLSDLLGYLYLCWFFQELPGITQKRDWCINELLKEYAKQVFEEGTDYESTTAYHCLVTEIFDHMAMICKHMHIALPSKFHEKLARMHAFIAWCHINDHDMVKIGDDDSGSILKIHNPAEPARIKSTEIHKTYPNLGLSIIKTKNWHITFRHHAYTGRQPSAHFHNDALSITLAIDGIPIIIDPGSYLYTASPHWRNYFRSVRAHNTLYVKGHEPIPFDERLFALAIPENNKPHVTCNKTVDSIQISSSHNLYNRFGLEAHRTLDWTNDRITITDQWIGQTENHILACNFTLHPAIDVAWHNDQWILSHANRPLLALHSALNFQPYQAWVSQEYGVKVKSIGLKAHYSGIEGKESNIVFIKL